MSFLTNKDEFKLITKSGKELRKNLIYKKNELSQKYICNLNTKDGLFLDFLISLIEPPKNKDGSDLLDKNGNIRPQFTKFCFHKNKFLECIGNNIDTKNNYSLEDSIVKINSVSYFLKDKNIKNKHKEATLVKIIDKCKIDYDTGLVYLKFDESCFKFLFNINKQIQSDAIDTKSDKESLINDYGKFYAYEFVDEICFKSKYSRPLFNYLLSFKGYRTKILYVEDLKKVCGLKKTQYTLYKSFKQRVLNEALKEINLYSNFNISIVDEIKDNFKYPIKINFKIEEKNVYEYASRVEMINNKIDGINNKNKKENIVMVQAPEYI